MNSENKKNLKNDDKGKLLQVSLSIYATFYPKYYLLETLLKNRLFQSLKEKLGEDWFSLQLDSRHENNLFKNAIPSNEFENKVDEIRKMLN